MHSKEHGSILCLYIYYIYRFERQTDTRLRDRTLELIHSLINKVSMTLATNKKTFLAFVVKTDLITILLTIQVPSLTGRIGLNILKLTIGYGQINGGIIQVLYTRLDDTLARHTLNSAYIHTQSIGLRNNFIRGFKLQNHKSETRHTREVEKKTN